MAFIKPRKSVALLFVCLLIQVTLHAQTRYDFPRGNYWALDAGIGISNFLVEGTPLPTIIIDPKLWLSPRLTVGSRAGFTYAVEPDEHNILTFEGQVYLRWNFLTFGKTENPANIFAQGGLGLVSAYRGWDSVFDEVTRTRGSLLFDAALGITVPISERWHFEPSVRGGYPHIWGVSLTAGYKFPLPKSFTRETTIQVIQGVPPSEIIRHVLISAVEFVLFGPDIGSYNVGIDPDARQLNELVLNYAARTLRENPNFRVRIEGHANPYTISASEADELMTLSAMRSNVVAEQLRLRGVPEDQIVIVSFGGTRTATSEWDVRNRNRRVELIILQVAASGSSAN
ncbi:MAG: OmpA family protein [Treponema sp.]|nr:OmpA family protein [Treponema sp.]